MSVWEQGGRPSLLWPLTAGPPTVLPAPPPLCRLGEGKPALLTLCLSLRPFRSVALAASTGEMGQTDSCWASAEGGWRLHLDPLRPPSPSVWRSAADVSSTESLGFSASAPLAWELPPGPVGRDHGASRKMPHSPGAKADPKGPHRVAKRPLTRA